MARGTKTGGRQKGTPNKTTAEVRAAIALVAQNNVERLQEWLEAIDDPAKRVALFLSICEFHIPKLARTELTGNSNAPLILRMSDGDEHL